MWSEFILERTQPRAWLGRQICSPAQIGNGQGDGICTRTVRVTGGDASCYITTLVKMARRAEARRAKAGAPGRTRTDEYGFTKPARGC